MGVPLFSLPISGPGKLYDMMPGNAQAFISSYSLTSIGASQVAVSVASLLAIFGLFVVGWLAVSGRKTYALFAFVALALLVAGFAGVVIPRVV
jgi:hypothetical protein